MYHSSPDPSISDLWDRYDLDPLRGILYNRRLNRISLGTSSVDHRNYKRLTATVKLNGKSISLNYGKVVHAWVNGYWAREGFHIDHINHDSHDNRPWNLRCVTVRENNQNRVNQKSPGIYWNKRLNKWQAQIRIQGEKVYLGVFKSEADALGAYITACEQNGYAMLPEVKARLTHLEKVIQGHSRGNLRDSGV
jgi:hypothetical protein